MSLQTSWPATAVSGSTQAQWLQSVFFLRDGQGLAVRLYAPPHPTPVHEPPLVALPQVRRSPASLPEFPALKHPLLTPLLQCRLRMPSWLCSVLPTTYRTKDGVQIPALPLLSCRRTISTTGATVFSLRSRLWGSCTPPILGQR